MILAFNLNTPTRTDINDKLEKQFLRFDDTNDYYLVTDPYDLQDTVDDLARDNETLDRVCFNVYFFEDEEILEGMLNYLAEASPSTELVLILDGKSSSRKKADMYMEAFEPYPNYTVINIADGKMTPTRLQELSNVDLRKLERSYPYEVKTSKFSSLFGKKKEEEEEYEEDEYEEEEYEEYEDGDEPEEEYGYEEDELYTGNSYEEAEYEDDYTAHDNPQEGAVSEDLSQTIYAPPRAKVVIYIGDTVSKAYIHACTFAEQLCGSSKTLLIELDSKKSNCLSMIDTERYYDENKIEGISKQKTFEDEKSMHARYALSIMANGHGVPVKASHVSDLYSRHVFDMYDYVVMHGTYEDLQLFQLNPSGLMGADIRIIMEGSREGMLSGIAGLSDRDYVKPIIEDTIFENRMLKVYVVVETDSATYRTDLDYIKHHVLCTRGDWPQLFEEIYI